ncbi:hypothetical protein ACFY5J_06430 [Peribacillus butanolivorans]|uniref:hypothetical protein n=1 Tax=Peribacillus butanolivorans TaxID=421767 RepID=UPI0036294AD5
MKKNIVVFMLLVCIFYLSGCFNTEIKTVTSKNPDAEEVLKLDKNADIFQWEKIIYKTDIEWVNELKLTKNESVGEITEVFSNGFSKSLKDGMANQLPIGAKIYSTKERDDVLIVEYNGKVKYYLALTEG